MLYLLFNMQKAKMFSCGERVLQISFHRGMTRHYPSDIFYIIFWLKTENPEGMVINPGEHDIEEYAEWAYSDETNLAECKFLFILFSNMSKRSVCNCLQTKQIILLLILQKLLWNLLEKYGTYQRHTSLQFLSY